MLIPKVSIKALSKYCLGQSRSTYNLLLQSQCCYECILAASFCIVYYENDFSKKKKKRTPIWNTVLYAAIYFS